MNKNDLLLLFDRPKEPLFTPKGEDNVSFEVPPEYLESRFRPISTQLTNRFTSNRTIKVKQVKVPDMKDVEGMSRHENFSMFMPIHKKLAGRLIDILLSVSNEDFTSVAIYARERVNPYLFNYAYSVAILHRPDTKNINIPSLVTSFPDKFVDGSILQQGREELEIVPDGNRMPIIIPRNYTATDADPEHRLAYFREDLGVNLHHWHWHLVYPFSGSLQVVQKDRRGELFYYMHQQLVARYNFERLSNQLGRVERFLDLSQPIKEAYFPKLDSLVASRGWPGRVANLTLQDINRVADQLSIDLSDMERWRQRIYDVIHSSRYRSNSGETLLLNETDGIDVLGNLVEAVPNLSPNRNFYGDFHNFGHALIGLVHDPTGKHLEPFGVMADPATTMRDPLFYRWHATIDDIFQEYKQTLPAYTMAQLGYENVTIQAVSIDAAGKTNEINTFWMQSDVNLSRGLDFAPRGSVFARFTHLNHRPFNYSINVSNQGGARMGTCRIFLSPKNDESGRRMLLRDQRLLMTEMDRFTVSLRPGVNTITRRSDESSVTIPFERTFRDLDAERPAEAQTDAVAQFNFCGCGWPAHMLVPRGTPEGLTCELFVMISNYDDDRIEQTIQGQCNDSFSFCGIKDRLYPDRRPMGFPFDRFPRSGTDNLSQFLTPNMRVQDVTIRFSDSVERNPKNPTN